MKQTTFQHPEIRDANDNIIQQGTYGKESPLVNSTNDGVLDYINNNLEALHDNINGSRIYVANKSALPATGDLSAMYIAEDTGKWYLWDGSKYIETDNARKIADEAIAARDAAKASQTAAKTSETNAKTSESNATASEQAAATSAGAAKTSEQNAGTQANTAKSWATATTSPDGATDTASTTGKTQSAKSWAMYSKDRATAAATSASAAAGSASAAKTSETNAASSKSAAATSATNAANSATAAANSAAAAANSAREQQADWAVTDTASKAFIKNKPDVLLKSGGTVTGTITASKFSGPLTGDVTGTADKAIADGKGNNIVNTYVAKSALASSVTTATGKVTTLTATDSTLTNLTVTGQTTVPTANAGNSSKAIANTEFVAKSISALVNGAPDQLNTLNELAKALGNDSNFASTVTAELAKKLNSTEAESTYATKTEARVLPGTVTAFSGTFKDGYPVNKNTGLVDKEWHLCDGTNGTPDLRNRFIYGGDGTNNGATGGEANVTLKVDNIPAHGHTADVSEDGEHTHTVTTYTDGGEPDHNRVSGSYAKRQAGKATVSSSGKHKHEVTIDSTGGGQPHNNMPPYYVLAYIMKL